MMLLEQPRIDLTSKAIGGEESTFSEILDSTIDSMRYVENSTGRLTSLSRAADERIDAVKKATGVELSNPYDVSPDLGFAVVDGRVVQNKTPYLSEEKRVAAFHKQLEELAAKHTEQADIIAPHRPIVADAEEKARQVERRFEDTWSRSSGGVGSWSARLAGGFYGTLYDPLNVSAMALGGGPAGAGAKGLLWMALKQGAINAGAETGIQPFVQSWRKQAGLPYGLGLATTNVAGAALFGAGLDIGVRSAVRGVRRVRGKPYLGPEVDTAADFMKRIDKENDTTYSNWFRDLSKDEKIATAKRIVKGENVSTVRFGEFPSFSSPLDTLIKDASVKISFRDVTPTDTLGKADDVTVSFKDVVPHRDYEITLSPIDALDKAAADAPDGSLIKRAYQGDEAALRELAEKTGAVEDPATRHVLAELENEKLFPAPPKVEDGTHMATVARMIREQSGAAELPPGDAIIPQVTRQMDLISDDAAAPAASFHVEGKPVSFRSVDPASVKTDAATFQFKSGGDVAGVTSRLTSVQRWDPMSAGKAIVYERINGEMVIADGHQRLGLAKRLSEQGQDAKLDTYIFREADGWKPEDVRAYAALKNMRELSGHSIDMARIMRERPDLIDGSLPLSDAKLREAAMLARLSPEAFDATVAGRLPSGYAALIGESVGDVTRHFSLLNEMAAADLGNINQARLYLKQLMELPTTTETQLTLFGEETFTRTVLVERAKVLDGALKLLRADKRIFGLLEREAKAIGAAGNVLAREINEARAQNAAQLAELIETLATSKGTVATILNDAAAAVARGLNPSNAAKAFVKRVGDILDKEGINGLLRADETPAPDLAPVRMDDPVGPEAKEQIADLEAAAEGQETLFSIRAFHGSPYDFERFDITKIGTGEGAQSFGHGLYFAESDAVSGAYLVSLLPTIIDEGSLKPVKTGKAAAFIKAHKKDFEAAISSEFPGFPHRTVNRKPFWAFDDGTSIIGDGGAQKAVKSPTVHYEVSIDVNPEHLLDWDLPLSKQDRVIQDALAKIDPDQYSPGGSDYDANEHGQMIYHRLLNKLQSEYERNLKDPEGFPRGWGTMVRGNEAAPQVSDVLRKAGIPGIRYLDQGSRAAGEGSRNFVIFDDKLVKIVAKDGKPVTPTERADILDQAMGEKPAPEGQETLFALPMTKWQKSATLGETVEEISDARPEGQRPSEAGLATGGEGRAAAEGFATPGISARRGEGEPGIGTQGSDARILRAESGTFRDDGSIVSGRIRGEKGRDASGISGEGEIQKVGETDGFEIRGFRGRVTAENVMTAQQLRDARLDPSREKLSQLVYRVYETDADVPSGKGFSARALAEKEIAHARIAQHLDGTWEVQYVKAAKPRKGIATKLYKAIEDDLGIRMSPSGTLTKDGLAFWKKRSPASVQWHTWSSTDQFYVSPRWIADRLDDIGLDLATIKNRPVPHPMDAIDTRSLLDERKRLMVMYGKLPAEARAAKETMFHLPGFYSPAIRAAQAIRQEKGTGEQFWKQITKVPGVKKDELDTMMLEEFLKGKKSITKDEVLAYMRAHQVELEERVLGGEGIGDVNALAREQFDIDFSESERWGRGSSSLNDWLDDYSRDLRDKYDAKHGEDAHQDATPTQIIREVEGQDSLDSLRNDAYAQFESDYREAAQRRLDDEALYEDRDSTKFSGHKIPGGENYRELLIRYPKLEGKYRSKHFEDQEIVHLRVDDRTGPNGEKVLFINEVQSDLHQAGRKAGYGKSKAEIAAQLRQANDELRAYLDAGGERDALEYDRLAERVDELAFVKEEGAPDAPFKSDLWLELALKRSLQYASEHGYDAVSWARSDQIAKAVGADSEKLAVQYNQKIGRFLDRYTKKWSGKVEQEQLPDFAPNKAAPDVEPSWTSVEGGPVQKQVVSGQNQILRLTPEMRAAIIEGQPLFAAGKQQPAATPSLRGSTLSARASEAMVDIRAEIDKVISKALPPEWKVEVRENLTFGDLAPGTRRRNPGVPPELEIEGAFDPYERIIYVSMAALDPVERAFEEAGHALKASRLIPDADYSILRAKATEIGARERFGIDERYGEVYGNRWKDDPAKVEYALEEEAIMQMVAARARGDTFGKPINTILDRVIKFLRAVRDMLGIKGFRTFDDVFEDITEGRFAQTATEESRVAGRFQAASEVMASVGKGKEGAIVEGEAPKGAEGVAATPKAAKPEKQLTSRQQGKLTRRIINESAAEGKLTREDADALIERLDVLEKHHKNDTKAATEQLTKEMEAEALHRKRQAALTEQAKRRVDQVLMNFRDARGQADPAKAMVAMLENLAQHELPQGTMAVQNHYHAIFGMAISDLDNLAHEFKKNFFTGATGNKARLRNVVREMFGENTGDELAKTMAAAASETMEKLRLRFNAAGGAIGKRKGWGLVQWHDPVALIRAGRAAWIDAITPELDPSKMYTISGSKITPADLRQSLDAIYTELTTEGWAEREASMANRGLGKIANTRGDHRFLVFKDADAWLRYAERFGLGDDPFAVIVNHIKGMSKDIAAMEVLGPNPRAMLTYMQQWVEKHALLRRAGQPAHFPAVTEIVGREFTGQKGSVFTTRDPKAYAARMIKRAEDMYGVYRGHTSAAIDRQFAEISQTARNINVGTKLGGASISAVGDLFWQVAARKFAGLPVTRMIGDIVREIRPGGEREARRAGIIADTYMHMYNEAAREHAATAHTRISGFVADRVITLSGLNGITRAGNHAFAMSIFAHLADMTARPFADLDGAIQRTMRRHGLDAPDWEAIRLDATGRPVTADFLTATAVREAMTARGLDPSISERYLAMAIMESQYATLTGTLRGRALMTQGLQAGTVGGELWRHLFQFKAFAVNIAILQIERMAREFVSQGLWRGAQYAAFAATGAIIGGALIEQLQQMRAGKDPADMTKPEFWGKAAIRSGGMSIWGDFLYASESRFGGGVASTVAGPTASTIQDIANLGWGITKRTLPFSEEKTNVGREAANLVRRYTPGTSIWYLRPVWNRVFMDNLQRLVDPEAEKAFRRQMQKARKDYGQEFWWSPGQRSPSRPPRMGAALPALQ